MEHFGVKLIKRKLEFKLLREEFALINTKPSLPFFPVLAEKDAYTNVQGTAYREEWCNEYRELCLKNYDLNMEFYSMLDKIEFNTALESFLKDYRGFNQVFDLSKYSETAGYYIMVLDEYKQIYIGKTDDIKKRIMQHWSRTKPFDRILFPMYAYDKSCFSIDLFRALDTTRLFVWKRKLSDGVEKEMIRNFPSKFCTNRIGGDITKAIQAIATMNRRQF